MKRRPGCQNRHARYTQGVSVSRFLLLTAMLGGSVQAVSLTPTQRLNLPGPAPVTALNSLPDGSRLLCLGTRWVNLNRQGQVTLAVPLTAPCQMLQVSPDGTRLLTSPDGKVWTARDGALLRELTDAPFAGFLNNQAVLLRSSAGLESLNVSTGQRSTLRPGSFTALNVSPDGQRAVVSDGQRVQFLSLPDLNSLSAYRCDEDCTVRNVTFTPDGRTAAVQVGRNLIGLWNGRPATTVQRNVENVTGFVQPDNTVLTISEAGVEVRDFQTGRREKLVTTGVTSPAALLPGGRILALSDKGELLDTDPAFRDVKRLPLPAGVHAGGLDASGNVYTLNRGVLSLGQKPLNGTYWAVETMNKTTWALRSDTDGGIQVGTLGGENFTPIPGSPRTATHLSVNHWGNHAAVWDDETLWVVSQAKNRVVATMKLAGKVDSVSLSPDATRVYLFPGSTGTGAPHMVTVSGGKRSALAATSAPATAFQISGNGTTALLDRQGNLYLTRPKRPAMTTETDGNPTFRFSPDSRWLAYTTRTAPGLTLNLLNTETGKIEASSSALAGPPTFLTWSADSKKLAVGTSLLNELSSVTLFEVK